VKEHLSNAAYGVLDYAAYPIGMLLVAPVVLHKLGPAEYGLWIVATAVVSTGGIVASGFGDANIQHVASLRSSGNKRALEHVVRSMMGINLTLGILLSLLGWLLAPVAARHIMASDMAQQHACLVSLRIASCLMLVRAMESVSISTYRAFEQYGAAVRISIAVRLLSLAAIGVLAYNGHGTVSMMAVSGVMVTLGTWFQLHRLRTFLNVRSLRPAFTREAARALFSFGIFSWLQAVAGVILGQVDRLLLGVSLGAAAVASYALCIQLAQPIFGFAAAGLHFLFPYLSGRANNISTQQLKKTLLKAFVSNLLLVAAGTALLLGFGVHLLHAWAGEEIARTAAPIFPIVVIGSALLGLSVTGNYALLAFGLVRTAAWINVTGGAVMLLLMWFLLHRSGVHGLALARLCYGALSLLVYLPLMRRLSGKQVNVVETAATPQAGLLQEASPS
jgi:O-antigen/teichoic acid export membrane protein